ncbi:MAG: hypothetical protein BGO07_04355 [Alphaproteobacteria bacterium 40-19]|nr:MAG: hypothetical protein BGO07_04355 [Alphaproteobacteria bacterium 40-19]
MRWELLKSAVIRYTNCLEKMKEQENYFHLGHEAAMGLSSKILNGGRLMDDVYKISLCSDIQDLSAMNSKE